MSGLFPISAKVFTILLILVHSSDMIEAYPKTQEIQFSSFFSLFLFQTTKPHSRNAAGLCASFRVFKFKIEDAHRIAVLNAHLLEALEEAGLSQLAVKVHARLVVVKVDIVHQLHDPRPGDDPQIVVLLNLELLRVS